jgi:hypothetical protein
MDKVCSACGKTQPISEFISGINGRVTKNCESCRGPRRKSMRSVPKEERTRRHKEWRYSNGRTKEYMDNYNMQYHNGMNMEEFEKEVLLQGGTCKICSEPPTQGFDRLCIDHNHQTMQYRGLLCSKCNTAIGLLNENPDLFQKIHDYLEEGKRSSWILTPIKNT